MEFRRVLFRSCQYLHREIAMTDNAGTGDAFRRRLATARDSRKISQGELAKKTGLPASSISHFEGGGRKPSFDNLLRLADALDVTTDYLLGRSEDVGTSVAAQKLQKHLDGLDRKSVV